MIKTTEGLLEVESLTVKDIINMEDNARVTATEWYLGEKLVRRDVHVNILNGLSFKGEQATL